MSLPRRRKVRWAAAAGVLLVVAAGVSIASTISSSPPTGTRAQLVVGTPESGATVSLDTTIYFPSTTPAPAVLLAHGFGGSKTDLASQARSLAQRGYVVLAYTARGFGRSGGLIHLDAPSHEVADASKLISYLATLPQVRKDAPGDPRVGVAGSSYGGGLALLLAPTTIASTRLAPTSPGTTCRRRCSRTRSAPSQGSSRSCGPVSCSPPRRRAVLAETPSGPAGDSPPTCARHTSRPRAPASRTRRSWHC